MEYINVIAILLSPIIAVCITFSYQNRNERKKIKNDLFFKLMKYRQSMFIPSEYVEALNSIDVVFYKDQNIVNLWAQYYDNLASETPNLSKRGHLHIDLLSAIALHLGYSNLKQTQIDRYYEPILYQNQQNRQQQISDELLRLLKASEHYGAPRIKND